LPDWYTLRPRQYRSRRSAWARASPEGYLGAGAEASARSIAEAYLRQIGSETSPAAIEASAAATLRTISATADENAAIAALTEAVQRDFRDQRTVELGGWVLSRTEVELCVLTLLAN
jgi:hypothetical protein